ncbi:kinesin heavy chain [Drosophila elegans]|uniref:kinesin heavy chain n=1 Tax=Drosophila elegans TaxID=30023 RepID=UPI001BC853B3|nr:kinesin heavy chain [Drosophila elegans]
MSQMRVYLFRKLLAPAGKLQEEVAEEAISEVIDQVLGGRTSTVFNCGGLQLACDPADMVTRILGELFASVYSMEVNMEVHVSVRHVQLSGDSEELMANLKGISSGGASRDHFVATPRQVYAYIERVMSDKSKDCPHLIFTVYVRQTNGEESWKCCGKLQLVHLKKLSENSPTLQSDSPLDALVTLFQALAHNPKTHIRYHNIRLSRVLQQLMGCGARTVLISYTNPPEVRNAQLVTPAPSSPPITSMPAKVWWGLFRLERKRYCCLRDKVLGMLAEQEKDELEKFLERLENSSEEEEMKQESCLMLQKMQQIRSEAEMSIEKLEDLQLSINQLAQRNQHLELHLSQKNSELDRQSLLLSSAHMQLADQQRKFQEKMTEYSDLFQELWQRQSLVSQKQEELQRRQLSQLFDTICRDTQRWRHRKLGEEAVAEEPSGRP